MSKFVSILIPYYNEKELLIRCLKSINCQTLLPAEVIIYDDASTFKAVDYVNYDEYKFPIRLIRGEENKGPGYGRNIILNLATTEYVRFLDADDELYVDAIALIEQQIEKTKADCILNEVSTFNENNELLSEKVIGLTPQTNDIFPFSLTHALLPSSATYKRDVIIGIGGFKERDVLPQSEDADLNRRFFLKTNNFSFIDKSLAKQNIRMGSHSHTGHQEVWPSGLKSLLSLKSEIKPEHAQAYAEAILQTGVILYERENYEMAKTAFKEYSKTGLATFKNYNPIKRLLAKTIGALNTEHLLRCYRLIMPEKIRRNLHEKTPNS